jgi:hypothetical protein
VLANAIFILLGRKKKSIFAIWNVILLLFLFDCAVTVSAVEGRKARKPDRWRGVAGYPTCFIVFEVLILIAGDPTR